MSKRRHSRKALESRHAPQAALFALFAENTRLLRDMASETRHSFTIDRNAAGQLVARRGDGVEFVGPVTL